MCKRTKVPWVPWLGECSPSYPASRHTHQHICVCTARLSEATAEALADLLERSAQTQTHTRIKSMDTSYGIGGGISACLSLCAA